MNIVVTPGSDLSAEVIELMAARRIAEYGTNNKDFRGSERASTFFFLQEADRILSFGMLKPLTIEFLERAYDVLGIGNIIAVEKGKGFGRLLMDAIKEDLTRRAVVGIGFCDAMRICGFYRKCGFDVAENLAHRFSFRPLDGSGRIEQQRGDRGVIYLEPDGSHLVREILASAAPIIVRVPFW